LHRRWSWVEEVRRRREIAACRGGSAGIRAGSGPGKTGSARGWPASRRIPQGHPGEGERVAPWAEAAAEFTSSGGHIRGELDRALELAS